MATSVIHSDDAGVSSNPALTELHAERAELAARLADMETQAVPIRADIFRLDAAIAILRGSSTGPRIRAQQRPEWFADLGRLILDVLRGAREPGAVGGRGGHAAGRAGRW